MLKEQNLYKKIIDLLVNIFKQNDLKMAIVKTKKLREHVVLQINNLLYLEKQYDCEHNKVHYAIEFAQALVNLTEKEEVIEKNDNKTFKQIEEDYSFLLTHLFDVYGQNSEIMSTSCEINVDLIKKIWQLNESATKSTPIRPEILSGTDFRQNQGQNNDFNHRNQNADQFSKDQIIQTLKFYNKLPNHPATDAKFYPFKTKPEKMPIFKLLLTIFVSITFLSYFFILFYSSVKSVNINPTLLPSSFKEIWIHKQNDQISFSMPNNLNEYNSYYGSSNKQIVINFESMFIFSVAFFILLATTYCGFHLVKHQQKIRDKFSINWYIIGVLFFNILLVFFYWLFKYTYYRFHLTAINKGEVDLAKKFSDICTEIIKNSYEFKLIKTSIIIASILAGLTLGFLFYLTCINPRIDKNKLKKADLEYEKMIHHAFENKEYLVDEEIFKN